MIKYLEEIIAAQNVDDLWSSHCERMRNYGFDRLLYGVTQFSNAQDFRELDDILILTNHSHSYIKGYIGDRMFERGPMLRWCRNNRGACLWSWIRAEERNGTLTQTEAEVVRFSLNHGVRAGVTIHFPDISARSMGGISLCAQPSLRQEDIDGLWAEHGQEITVVNSIFHMRLSLMPYPSARRKLTARQKEVLEWVGDGKTAATIAAIMGLTPTTVEKHLRLAREALNVETTAQAVLKAAMQKQIFAIPSAPRKTAGPATVSARGATSSGNASAFQPSLPVTIIKESQLKPANVNTPARSNGAANYSPE